MKETFRKIESFALSEFYPLFLFLLVYGLVVLDMPAVALCILLALECVICLACDDLVPMLLPLLFIFCLCFLCQPYFADMYWIFLFVIPCAPILLWRFIRDLPKVRLGPAFPGLVAVSVALMLGGVGSLSAAEYFAPGAVYHILGLGPLMIFLYLFFKSNASVTRAYHVGDKIAAAMYLCVLLLAFFILRAYIMHAHLAFGEGGIADIIREGLPWRNIAANLMVLLLPFVFYYARRHHPIHAVVACLIYVIMAASGSRGAALCGIIVMALGFLYLAYRRKKTALVLLVLFVAGAVAAFFLRDYIAQIMDAVFGFHNFGSNGDHFIELEGFNIFNESRFKMFLRSFEDFWASPLFGRGLGYLGNTDIFDVVNPWMIGWYHSIIPQIIGSLGLVGILAYGYQFLLRVRLILQAKHTAFVGALAMAYFALLLYSLIDPGLFSPLPYGALCVLIFVLLEENAAPRPVSPTKKP